MPKNKICLPHVCSSLSCARCKCLIWACCQAPAPLDQSSRAVLSHLMQFWPAAWWQNNTCNKNERVHSFVSASSAKLLCTCLQLKSVNSYHSYISAAPWNNKAPSAGILGGVMAVTESLQAWNSLPASVLPCTQSSFPLNNCSAPQASHFLSWGCVDIDLPQVHGSAFIIPSHYPAGVKK